MPMRSNAFDFISSFSTLWQVILGAFLATAGGLVANELEWHAQTRRRERNAALFFGEVLSGFAMILGRADQTKQIGDPFGPITLRILRSARRELELYERNRESLLDLRDADLRGRVHALALRLAMPLDGIVDTTQEIVVLEAQLRSRTLDEADRAELATRLGELKDRQQVAYDYILENAKEIGGVLAQLGPRAKHTFTLQEPVAATTGLSTSVE